MKGPLKSCCLFVLVSVCLLQLAAGHSVEKQASGASTRIAYEQQTQLATILPQLQAIHESVKMLMFSNAELKAKISAGLTSKLNETKAALSGLSRAGDHQQKINQNKVASSAQQQPARPSDGQPLVNSANGPEPKPTTMRQQQQQHRSQPPPSAKQAAKQTTTNGASNSDSAADINFAELMDFNRWVGLNLDYAVANTQATIETLKEEAQQNNGTVDYSEQAIKDGFEGVKYWQQAITFQDKTLKNEKFVDLLD